MIRHGMLREILAMAFDSLKAHKLRSFLTLLGVMIGVMTVIGMVSVIQGLNASFLKELQAAGSDLIVIHKYNPVQMGRMSEEERRREDLTYEDAEAIERECPLVKAVSANLNVSVFDDVKVKFRNATAEGAFIIGINDRFPIVYNIYLPREGRHLTGSEIEHNAKVCVLGFETAETLFPHMSPVGKQVRIGPEGFTVVGVLSKRGQIFGQSRDNLVAIPITTLMKTFRYEEDSLEIGLVPKDPETIQETIEQVTAKLRVRRKVPVGKPNDFAIFTQETMLDLYNQITGAAYLVMVVISSIGLLVGGIGVMNIMLVSAKERTREIGIRKALGARSNDILKQFLIEAMVLTGTGGVFGTAIGFGVAFLVRAVTPLPASVTGWSVILGLAVSISVGLFFGIVPARRAAKVDPIISLRYE
jgi:putative ABC transport system permease protein